MDEKKQGKPVKPIIFQHLIKCAGTTVESILKRQYGASRTLQFGSVQDAEKKLLVFNSLPEEERKKTLVFMGHFNFRQRSQMSPGATCITMLRHPVDRVISEYYYILAHPEHEFHSKLVKDKMSLKEFAASRTYQTLDNHQTKYLSGVGGLEHGGYSAEAVETARENLEKKFAIVGLTEKFDESVILMKRAFGWQTPYYLREKVTPNRPGRDEVPADAIESIEEYNRMDIELYEFARANLETIIARQHPSFALEVEAFKILNVHCTDYLEALKQWRDQPERAEYQFLLLGLSNFLRDKRFEAAQLVISHAIGQFPDASELYTLSEMLKEHLAYAKRLESAADRRIPAAPAEEAEPIVEKQQ